MASAQVMPNSAVSSRKQGHLEAGKKRLEEFRKKKAEGRAKKASSTGHLLSDDADKHDKFSQNHEIVGDGTAASNDGASGFVITQEDEAANNSRRTGIGSLNGAHDSSVVAVNSNHAVYNGPERDTETNESAKLYDSSRFSEHLNGYYNPFEEDKNELSHISEPDIRTSDDVPSDQIVDSDRVPTTANAEGTNKHLSSYSSVEAQTGESRNSSKYYMPDSGTPGTNIMSTIPQISGNGYVQNRPEVHNMSTSTSASLEAPGVGQYSHSRTSYDGTFGFGSGGRKISDSINRHLNIDNAPWHGPEPSSSDYDLPFRRASDHYSLPSMGSGATSTRSRPSFLDTLGVPRVSSLSSVSNSQVGKANAPEFHKKSKSQSMEIHLSATAQQLVPEHKTIEEFLPSNSSEFVVEKGSSKDPSISFNEGKLLTEEFRDHHEHRHDEFPTVKKDEDFASLEQHIEDLTQEKFSLQRALDTSRTLAESLAAENSSLAESYNQQGKIVSQLKLDMERLQEEVNAQLLALESFKLEYANAQLECQAADERAKLLASEVIGLEEKALRLRSNELKLEKQLENLNFEVTSYRRKVSILDKERQDFQSTIDALQEEKKLLQTKLRKASVSGKGIDAQQTANANRDASTSTEDLGGETNLVDRGSGVAETMVAGTINASLDPRPAVDLFTNSSSSSLLPGDSGSYLPDAHSDAPLDQLRMIENISSLISELAMEKEELIQALKIESSNSSKLKDMNKDLSQKLEAQTQRLELLAAQRMASQNIQAKPIDSHSTHYTTVYADEGDEVVERVLGWIMKLFPGGPAKRRTSKLL